MRTTAQSRAENDREFAIADENGRLVTAKRNLICIELRLVFLNIISRRLVKSAAWCRTALSTSTLAMSGWTNG